MINTKVKFFLSMLLTIVVTGCSFHRTVPLPKIQDKEKSGEVVFIRMDNFNNFGDVMVTFNNDNIKQLKSREYTILKLNTGSYTLGYKVKARLDSEDNAQQESFVVEVTPGGKLYFLFSYKFRTGYLVKELTEQESQEIIKDCTYMPIGQ